MCSVVAGQCKLGFIRRSGGSDSLARSAARSRLLRSNGEKRTSGAIGDARVRAARREDSGGKTAAVAAAVAAGGGWRIGGG